MDLDRFVLFTSGAGILVSGGQGAYAAANAFVDALAEYRRELGLTATAIAWGTWGGGGMAEGAAGVQLRRWGLREMSPASALKAFALAVASDNPCLVVADIDWERFVPSFALARYRPLIEEIPEAAALLQNPTGGVLELSELAQRLAGLGERERERALLEVVQSEVAIVLGYGEAAAVDGDRAFKDLGFDSLTAVELRNRLRARTGLQLPATLVFDHPTPLAAARELLARLGGERTGSTALVRATVAEWGEPLAIVGVGCRFPGGVASPEGLWDLVAGHVDAVGEFPVDRGWQVDDADFTRRGGFLYDAAGFDAGFFGVSPREALAMDPQQRLLLEVSWEALERAGIDPTSLRGSSTGVFAGLSTSDYSAVLQHSGEDPEVYALTGGSGAVLSGRVAYVLGLEGPAVTVDTACSSSLVALHLAGQALRSGECDLAFAGGVTVMSTPLAFQAFAMEGGLAGDGRCKAFGAGADGMGWSEGVGVVVLERLSDALRNGRRVWGVVRGSAVNQDGASNGLTAPNGPSQQRVIRQALANAGLTAAEVDVVEAHGTGTVLGDPIEAQALLATYGQDREGAPLWLGSIKSNIGHTSAAAGVAGLIKMVMAMHHEVLPATLHVEEPTPHVDWSSGAVELLREARPWSRHDGRPPRAGISSFGISGTNAHVILEAPPEGARTSGDAEHSDAESEPDAVMALVVSGASVGGLRGVAGRVAARLGADGVSARDVGWSLASGRAALGCRGVVVGEDRAALAAGLAALARGESGVGVVEGRVGDGRVGFVFSGQGSQRLGMGQGLYADFPVFREAFDEVCELLDGLVGRSLRDVVFGVDESEHALLNQTMFTQAGLFAFEVALVRLLRSFGVVPDVVLGHSIGELAAAHVAGVLTLEDAARLVGARGRLMEELAESGAMVALDASEAEAQDLVAGLDRVSVAAINGPASVVVSGDEAVVMDLAARWQAQGRRARRLQVSQAFHSPLIEPMLEDFATVARSLTYEGPQVTLISNVSGQVASPEVSTGDYWVHHARAAVRFGDGIATLLDQGVSTVVEIGPDGVLCAMAQEIVDHDPEREGNTVGLVPGLRSGRDEAHAFVTALAETWVRGVAVDWTSLFEGAQVVDVPTYAFERDHYWPKARAAVLDADGLGLVGARHPLLGAGVVLAGSDEVVFTGRLGVTTHPWLADHVVLGSVVVPGTALVELALRAGDEVGCARLDELVVEAPLMLPETAGIGVQVEVGDPDETGRRPVAIHARRGDDEPWTRHASGTLSPAIFQSPESSSWAQAWPPSQAVEVDLNRLYDELAGTGLVYGPVFRGLRRAWRDGEVVYAEVSLPDEATDVERFILHPALFDAALHAIGIVLSEEPGNLRLPFSWERVAVRAGLTRLRVRLVGITESTVKVDLADEIGRSAGSAASVLFRPATPKQIDDMAAQNKQLLLECDWTEILELPSQPSNATWAVVGQHLSQIAEAFDSQGLPIELTPDLNAVREEIETTTDFVLVSPETLWAEEQLLHEAAINGTNEMLSILKLSVADPKFAPTRLVIVTQGAVAVTDQDIVNPASSAIWGFVRSVQLEQPGELILVDFDGSSEALSIMPQAVIQAFELGESQVAVRRGNAFLPRLKSVPSIETSQASPWDNCDAVLVTGGTSGVGALLAKNVARKGAKHVILASRSGENAEGVDALVRDLEASGAAVTVQSCDIADREQLGQLLRSIPEEYPLSAIIHAAGVIDDGTLGSLTPQRVVDAMSAKVTGAINLHEMTMDMDLSIFAMCSSMAATFGSAGQAELRRSKCLSGWTGSLTAKNGSARDIVGVGTLGQGRHDRNSSDLLSGSDCRVWE